VVSAQAATMESDGLDGTRRVSGHNGDEYHLRGVTKPVR
jgi:hypothetical protein